MQFCGCPLVTPQTSACSPASPACIASLRVWVCCSRFSWCQTEVSFDGDTS